MELVPQPQLCFSQIASTLNQILFEPDTEAFHIMLCAVAAHTLKPHGYPPVWIMVVGPSGSGKTTVLDAFTKVPGTFRLNSLTPNTFLSGYKRKAEENSLLIKLGASPILLMKDFTSIISMRHEYKSEIIAQLREIYDGSFRKVTGMGNVIAWSGRLTLLTCCTAAVEDDRMTFRVMGDRFMEVHWKSPEPYGLVNYITNQEIATNLTPVQQLVNDYLSAPYSPLAKLTPKQHELLNSYANAAAKLRTPVIWDDKGHSISNVFQTEAPTRTAQTLTSIVLAAASLDREPFVRDQDMELALRVTCDSVPPKRLRVLKLIQAKNWDEYAALPLWVVRKTLAELEALGVLAAENPTTRGREILTPEITRIL